MRHLINAARLLTRRASDVEQWARKYLIFGAELLLEVRQALSSLSIIDGDECYAGGGG